MDACARAVIVAANEYFINNNNSNILNLQSQLESLQNNTRSLQSLKYFNTENILSVDCLARLVQIASDPNVKFGLAHKCIVVFHNLVEDSDLCTVLQSKFHLSECLASVLQNSVEKQSENFTLECIQLLMKLTYGQQINFHDSHAQYLLKFLIKQISSSTTELTQPCLGLLANICKRNLSVQTYIKSMACQKLRQVLLKYVADKNMTNMVLSLSIIISAFQQDELGERVLSGSTLKRTPRLLFNLLINGDAGITRRYAVDVFKDICKIPRFLNTLIKFEHLYVSMVDTVNLLNSRNQESVEKVFELLIEFCSTSHLRSLISSVLLKCPPLQDTSQLEEVLKQPITQSTPPLLTTMHWAAQPIENIDTHPASMLALDLLKEVFEELLFSDVKIEGGQKHVQVMVWLLLKTVHENSKPKPHTAYRQIPQKKTAKILQFLTVMCSDDDVKKYIASHVDAQWFSSILEYNISSCDNSLHKNSSKGDIQVVLFCLNLMSKLRRHVENLDDCFKLQLQDSKLIPFLASYLTCDNREYVQMALQLVTTAASLDIFLDVVLCDAVANLNVKQKEENTQLPTQLMPTVLNDTNGDKENISCPLSNLNNKTVWTEENSKSMQNIILKMENNLEMKDSKVSDLIQLYEGQLQSLKINEEHLENLLKTKSLELVQSDRLISQYRLNATRAEAELHKLRTILQESEKKCEQSLEQMNEIRLKKDNLEAKVEKLESDSYRLSTVAEEFEELKAVHSEIVDREEMLNRCLAGAQQELRAQTEQHDMLQKHYTSLKQQHDLSSEQLFKLEKECKQQSKLIKEKDIKLQETTKSLAKAESKCVNLQKDKEDLEKDLDCLDKTTEELRDQLSKVGDIKRNLQLKVSSLEQLCQEQESAIHKKDALLAQKEEVIGEQEEQISKHAQIAALIQSFSGNNKKSDS